MKSQCFFIMLGRLEVWSNTAAQSPFSGNLHGWKGIYRGLAGI